MARVVTIAGMSLVLILSVVGAELLRQNIHSGEMSCTLGGVMLIVLVLGASLIIGWLATGKPKGKEEKEGE